MNRRLVAMYGVVSGGALLLVGCGSGVGVADGVAEGDWDQVVEAANDEGSVVFYSTLSEPQNDRLITAFNQQYPEITVVTTRGGGDLYPKIEAEIQSGADGADVFALADMAWYDNRPDDLLELSGPEAAGWPASAWGLEGKSAVVTISPYTMFVWNTNRFPEGFYSWEDFLDPDVKGSLGLRTDVTKSVAGYLDLLIDEFGEGFLRDLAEQEPKFYPSAVPMTQAVASGEIGVTNVSLPSSVYELQEQGAPIDYMFPEPGYGIEYGIAALDNAKRPNAAVLFVDFSMSEAGQVALNGDGYGGAAGGIDVQGALDLSNYSLMDSDKYTPEVIAELEVLMNEIYG